MTPSPPSDAEVEAAKRNLRLLLDRLLIVIPEHRLTEWTIGTLRAAAEVRARAGLVTVPQEPTEQMRLALNAAAHMFPGDVFGQGAEGEWVWLNGVLAAMGGAQEEIAEEAAHNSTFEARHPDCEPISGTTLHTESGRELRAKIAAQVTP